MIQHELGNQKVQIFAQIVATGFACKFNTFKHLGFTFILKGFVVIVNNKHQDITPLRIKINVFFKSPSSTI